jgi:hypothetical protein
MKSSAIIIHAARSRAAAELYETWTADKFKSALGVETKQKLSTRTTHAQKSPAYTERAPKQNENSVFTSAI